MKQWIRVRSTGKKGPTQAFWVNRQQITFIKSLPNRHSEIHFTSGEKLSVGGEAEAIANSEQMDGVD